MLPTRVTAPLGRRHLTSGRGGDVVGAGPTTQSVQGVPFSSAQARALPTRETAPLGKRHLTSGRGGVVTGAGPTAAYLDTPATNASRFYRVTVLP